VRLLVAGLTGQLGHGLVEAAERADVELVPLVRPTARRRAADRVTRLFGPGALGDRTLEGDVTQPLWGLDESRLPELAAELDGVLDLAAEVDWTAGDEALFTTNVLGATHGLELARRLSAAGGRCRLFCLASSVHVAGARTGQVPEQRLGPDGSRTRYEQSKWEAEEAVLHPGREPGAPRVLVARIGGLIGSSETGATVRRNSLYMLADEWDRARGGVIPAFGRGRVDMLPRDVAGQLLLRAARGALEESAPVPEIVHVCAGEAAPRTDAVIEIARSLDATGRLAPKRRIPLPAPALAWVTQNAERFLPLSRRDGNALVGTRYLALDRTFERNALAALVGDDLPAPAAEEIARLTFEVGPPPVRPLPAGSLARYAA